MSRAGEKTNVDIRRALLHISSLMIRENQRHSILGKIDKIVLSRQCVGFARATFTLRRTQWRVTSFMVKQPTMKRGRSSQTIFIHSRGGFNHSYLLCLRLGTLLGTMPVVSNERENEIRGCEQCICGFCPDSEPEPSDHFGDDICSFLEIDGDDGMEFRSLFYARNNNFFRKISCSDLDGTQNLEGLQICSYTRCVKKRVFPICLLCFR